MQEEQHCCRHYECQRVQYAPSHPSHENHRRHRSHRSLLPGSDQENDQPKFYCGLSTKLNNDSIWFFMLNNFPKMFPIDRLKIKFVCNIEISRDSFGVAIHHDGFIAAFFYCQYSVHTAIIKFNSLADAVGP